jgi:hypothetical protein
MAEFKHVKVPEGDLIEIKDGIAKGISIRPSQVCSREMNLSSSL